MKILLVGDVFGQKGREILSEQLKVLKQDQGLNLIIVNGENIAHGRGITENYYKWLLEQNVSVVTLGNHTFTNPNIYSFIDHANKLVRPLNYGKKVPGQGYVTFKYNQYTITVFQVLGRTFDPNYYSCPFEATEELLATTNSDLYICDFHGEATSEKIAYGLHFDGRVDIIFGTHTHVQTNDPHHLPKGSFYITDLGMTGPLDGVIGVHPDNIIRRFLTSLPAKHEPMTSGRSQFSGLIVDVNINQKEQKVTSFELLHVIQ